MWRWRLSSARASALRVWCSPPFVACGRWDASAMFCPHRPRSVSQFRFGTDIAPANDMNGHSENNIRARPPVLIVGAGPAGLVAALTLRRNGVAVRVIERMKEFNTGVRGPGLQPRTQELLSFLGLQDDIAAISTKAHMIGKHGVGKAIESEVLWAESAEESPSIPFRSISDVNQTALEEVIRKHLALLGTTVERGVEMVGIEQTADKVTVQLSRDGVVDVEGFEYVISADGAKGRTRRMLGIPFVGEVKEADVMLFANVECEDVDRDHWHTWGEFGSEIFCLKPILPAPLFYIQALGPEMPNPLPHDTAGLQALLDKVSKSTEIKLSNASCVSEWRANIRMAEKFRVGRVFLAGDCVHCHSPAGAQGANTGMQDAVNISPSSHLHYLLTHIPHQANIAWKLAHVINGLAQPSLLDTYETERIPVVAEMLRLTTRLHHDTFDPAPDVIGTLDSGASREHDPYWRPKTALQLGINYRWSPIVLEGRDDGGVPVREVEMNAYGTPGDRVRAGDRAPEAPRLHEVSGGEETSLFELVAGFSRHTVLVFSAGTVEDAGIPVTLQKYQEHQAISLFKLQPHGSAGAVALGHHGVRTFIDSAGHAYNAYDVKKDALTPTYVVIRPDGIVGAYAVNAEQVHRYFDAFLS
ncbi:hypothetical protein DENSPDRAFT_324848 [Dentipellis sp. KUC8613]|nr:hypothetical protein DENSPDRAFT_324848 [Dentipellis sp. KUC8613]